MSSFCRILLSLSFRAKVDDKSTDSDSFDSESCSSGVIVDKFGTFGARSAPLNIGEVESRIKELDAADLVDEEEGVSDDVATG